MQITLGAAPSYDHASSLGRELTDEKRTRILKDDSMSGYVHHKKARGGLYLLTSDKHGANPLELVKEGLHHHDAYFRPGLLRLCSASLDEILATVDPVPEKRISLVGKEFTKAYLTFTFKELGRMTS